VCSAVTVAAPQLPAPARTAVTDESPQPAPAPARPVTQIVRIENGRAPSDGGFVRAWDRASAEFAEQRLQRKYGDVIDEMVQEARSAARREREAKERAERAASSGPAGGGATPSSRSSLSHLWRHADDAMQCQL
jgi:hypothetical protein